MHTETVDIKIYFTDCSGVKLGSDFRRGAQRMLSQRTPTRPPIGARIVHSTVPNGDCRDASETHAKANRNCR